MVEKERERAEVEGDYRAPRFAPPPPPQRSGEGSFAAHPTTTGRLAQVSINTTTRFILASLRYT